MIEKIWRGQCFMCGHYEINHGSPCMGYDNIGKCNCKKWTDKEVEI